MWLYRTVVSQLTAHFILFVIFAGLHPKIWNDSVLASKTREGHFGWVEFFCFFNSRIKISSVISVVFWMDARVPRRGSPAMVCTGNRWTRTISIVVAPIAGPIRGSFARTTSLSSPVSFPFSLSLSFSFTIFPLALTLSLPLFISIVRGRLGVALATPLFHFYLKSRNT